MLRVDSNHRGTGESWERLSRDEKCEDLGGALGVRVTAHCRTGRILSTSPEQPRGVDVMTLSVDARKTAIEDALRRMLQGLGEAWIAEVRFEVNSAHYSDLPQTTWLELEGLMWVHAVHNFGDPGFRMTGAGLLAALRLSGQLAAPEHKERCVRLRAALKDVVKGRELSGGLTDTYELCAKTGLTDTWILNAIDARFLADEWPKDHVDVSCKYAGREIRISGRFGTQRLSGLDAGPFTDP